MYETQRRFPRVPVKGTVRALLRRLTEPDALPVTLRTLSEGGLCVVVPGDPPENGARVTIEMALWRQMLYLPGNIVWTAPNGPWTTCGLRLHLEVTDAATRRAFAGYVRNQAAAPPPTIRAPQGRAGVPSKEAQEPPWVRRVERPYEIDESELDTALSELPEPTGEKGRAQELFDWIFRRGK